MRLWLREWLRVGPVIAIAGGLLWLLTEGDMDEGALLRSMLWAVVVWAACGLVWIGLHYARWDDEPARVAGASSSGPAQLHAIAHDLDARERPSGTRPRIQRDVYFNRRF